MPPIPPKIFPVRSITLPPFTEGELANGLPFYQVNQGTQELVRIELVFWAGRPYEQQALVGRTTTSLLKEGTLGRSGTAIAEHFDYYGAGLVTPFQMDTANVAMYTLNRQLPKVLPLFVDVLNEPAFSDKALSAFVKRRKHDLKEDISKSEVMAYRHITECYFGKEHPYGYNSTPEQYDQLQVEWLKAHHARSFHAQNGFVLISGRMDAATERYVHKQLGQLRQGMALATPSFVPIVQQRPSRLHLPTQASAQSAIRMGRQLFSRQHEDADGVYVMAQLLGGYFGSRLMENIREDKGYTYNIAASYDSLRFDGSLQIDTEVSPEFVEPCLREIHVELARLREELVPPAELEMLRNYLMGAFLTMVDGPFNWAETIRTLLVEQLDTRALERLIHKVQHIGPIEIQQLAERYLQPEDLWTVVAGEIVGSK